MDARVPYGSKTGKLHLWGGSGKSCKYFIGREKCCLNMLFNPFLFDFGWHEESCLDIWVCLSMSKTLH